MAQSLRPEDLAKIRADLRACVANVTTRLADPSLPTTDPKGFADLARGLATLLGARADLMRFDADTRESSTAGGEAAVLDAVRDALARAQALAPQPQAADPADPGENAP